MSTTMMAPAFFKASWVGRAKAGDHHAFLELAKVLGRRIFRIAKHITQNDAYAEDVLVETFLKACSDLNECPRDEKFWVWLVTISVREAFSKLRNRGGERLLADEVDPCEDLVVREITAWGDNYQERFSPEQTADSLEDALRSLDPMCRAVLVLRDIEEMPVEQTAQVLNRSTAAVEVCLLRARLQLREALSRRLRQQP